MDFRPFPTIHHPEIFGGRACMTDLVLIHSSYVCQIGESDQGLSVEDAPDLFFFPRHTPDTLQRQFTSDLLVQAVVCRQQV